MFDPDDLESIRSAKEEWEEEHVDPVVERFGERKDEFTTDTNGHPVKRVYTPNDVSDLDYEEDIGFPGDDPYTRGVYSTGYRGRLWTMRQYAGFGTPEETNERYQYLLDQGQTGLSMALDLPTQMGYDSDATMAAGEVGKSGVAIDTLDDMETVFDGIPLDEVSTSMTINAPAAVLLAMYIAIGDKQGVDREELRGTIQNDILKEYIARNNYIYPPEPSMRLITDIFEFCADETPKFNTISISGYHIREAGSTAAQEIAFTLADGIEYVQAAIDAGLDVDDFAPQLSFFFNAHNNVLEEVAKFRAARRLWAKIMEERFDAQNPKSMQLKFHTQTAGSTLTAQQPMNNVVRVAYQALGLAQACLDVGARYALEREQFGKPIARLQAVQWHLAEMATELEMAHLLADKAAWLKDQGKPYGKQAAMAKLACTEMAGRCADKALQIHGGFGYSKDYDVERYYRDVRVTRIYEGTSEIQKLVIARNVLDEFGG